MYESQRIRGTLVYSTPAAPNQRGAVLLLHGYGASGQDLISCADFFRQSEAYRWLFPEAAKELGGMGGQPSRAWFDIDVGRLQQSAARGEKIDFDKRTLNEMDSAAAKLAKVVEELGLDISRLVIGGFSQGAMVAFALSAHLPKACAGLLLFSGADVYSDSEFTSRIVDRSPGPLPRVFLSHGRLDPVLGFFGSESLRERLLAAGYEVEFREFRGGHEIPPAVLKAADAWVGKIL